MQLLSLNFINIMKKQTGSYQVVPVFSCFIISGGVNFEEKRCLFLLRENKVNNKNVINVIQWFEFDWGENDEMEWEMEWGGIHWIKLNSTAGTPNMFSWNTKYVQLKMFDCNCPIGTIQFKKKNKGGNSSKSRLMENESKLLRYNKWQWLIWYIFFRYRNNRTKSNFYDWLDILWNQKAYHQQNQ